MNADSARRVLEKLLVYFSEIAAVDCQSRQCKDARKWVSEIKKVMNEH
jgi:hypothetical protein